MLIVVNITKFALNLRNDSQRQLILNLNKIETQSTVNPSVLLRFLKSEECRTLFTRIEDHHKSPIHEVHSICF